MPKIFHVDSKLNQNFIFLILSLLTLLTFCVLSLSFGQSAFGPLDFFEFLTGNIPNPEDPRHIIFTSLRFPRTMAVLSVGAALGLSGALLQPMLQNPLAEPYTLGISGGASVGTVLVMVCHLSPLTTMLPLGAFLGSWITTLIFLMLVKSMDLWKSKSVILLGVMISLFTGSIVTVTLGLLEPNELHHAMFWLVGAFGSWRDSLWPVQMAVLAGSLFWTYLSRRELNLLLLDENLARSLGAPLTRIRWSIVVVVTLLTSVSVSIAGLIGFVGLLAPHITTRLMQTARMEWIPLMSSVVGGTLLLAADTLGRTLGQSQDLPTGGIISLIGAPFLIGLLLRNSKSGSLK